MGNTNSRNLTETNAVLDDIEAKLEQVMALLAPKAASKPVKAKAKAAKAVKATKAAKARKTVNRKPVANGTISGHKCLVMKNREQFIADHDWAQPHTSTSDLARAVIAGAPLVGVWALGPKTVQRLTGDDNAEAITRESQGGIVEAPKAKKAKKAKKGGKKVKAQVVKAEPVKRVSEAQQRRAEAPRDAMGRTTPKREWALREALAESGQYDRYEIEAQVAKAYAEGLIDLPTKG